MNGQRRDYMEEDIMVSDEEKWKRKEKGIISKLIPLRNSSVARYKL